MIALTATTATTVSLTAASPMMAMVHPSDASFSLSTPLCPAQVDSLFLRHLALNPLFARTPSAPSGSFHKIYIASLPPTRRSRRLPRAKAVGPSSFASPDRSY